MSAEQVELARRAYLAFQRAGVDAILEYLEPEIEWHMWEGFVRSSRVFHGHDGVREVLRVFEENFDELQTIPRELIDAGDRVVAVVDFVGVEKGSGEPVSWELAQVWTIGEGGDKAVRLEAFGSREEALAALDLEG